MLKEFFEDTYTRKTRLQPFLLVILPLGVATLAWLLDKPTGWGILWTLIVFCGGMSLFAQIGRDWGSKKQSLLFTMWDGAPTTRLLRHRDTKNSTLLTHRHQKLQQLLPNLKIPTAEEEQTDPKEADEIYETCTNILKEKTRDHKEFPLVFEELCNYGFRRNLWGMRPLGLITSIVGTLAIIALIGIDLFLKKVSIPPFVIICGAINLFFVVTWIFWFIPSWVKIAAEAYADRLLSSCDKL